MGKELAKLGGGGRGFVGLRRWRGAGGVYFSGLGTGGGGDQKVS